MLWGSVTTNRMWACLTCQEYRGLKHPVLMEKEINLFCGKPLMISKLFNTVTSIGLNKIWPMANKEPQIPEDFFLTCICWGHTWPKRPSCQHLWIIKLSAPWGLHVMFIMVEREQQLACHHDFLLSAHNAKRGGHSTHVHTHSGRQVQRTPRRNRGEMVTFLYASLGLCVFSSTQSFLPAVPPSPDTFWRRERGWDWWRRVCLGPQEPGPTPVTQGHTSSKPPECRKKTWAQRYKHRKHNILWVLEMFISQVNHNKLVYGSEFHCLLPWNTHLLAAFGSCATSNHREAGLAAGTGNHCLLAAGRMQAGVPRCYILARILLGERLALVAGTTSKQVLNRDFWAPSCLSTMLVSLSNQRMK